MATLKQMRDKADAKLAQFWDVLAAKQEAYHLKNDHYFQLLITGGRKVQNGEEYPFLVKSPNDEKYTMDIDKTWADVIPFEIQVDNFGNDTEKGFRATVTVELNDGTKYTRWRQLTDRRVKTQDYDSEDMGAQPVGDPYYVGDAPTIETSQWEQVIEEI